MVAYTCSSSACEVGAGWLGVQDHLGYELEGSLGYMRLHLFIEKNQKIQGLFLFKNLLTDFMTTLYLEI